jgi:hypothetical protein
LVRGAHEPPAPSEGLTPHRLIVHVIPVTRGDGSPSATASVLRTLGLARVDIRELEDDLLRVRGVDVDVEVVRGGGHASTGPDVN